MFVRCLNSHGEIRMSTFVKESTMLLILRKVLEQCISGVSLKNGFTSVAEVEDFITGVA